MVERRGCQEQIREQTATQPLSPLPHLTYQRRRVRDEVQEEGEALADKRQDHEDFRKIDGGTHAFGGSLDRITVECGGAAALVEGVEGGCRFLRIEEDGGAEGEVV